MAHLPPGMGDGICFSDIMTQNFSGAFSRGCQGRNKGSEAGGSSPPPSPVRAGVGAARSHPDPRLRGLPSPNGSGKGEGHSQNRRGMRRPSVIQEAGDLIPGTSSQGKTCQHLAVGAPRPSLLPQVLQSPLVCKAVSEPGLWCPGACPSSHLPGQPSRVCSRQAGDQARGLWQPRWEGARRPAPGASLSAAATGALGKRRRRCRGRTSWAQARRRPSAEGYPSPTAFLLTLGSARRGPTSGAGSRA